MPYITKKKALAMGFTHEGRLFGVPAWFLGDLYGVECVVASPKFLPLTAWCWLADKAYELASCFISHDTILASPIRVTGRIQKVETQ